MTMPLGTVGLKSWTVWADSPACLDLGHSIRLGGAGHDRQHDVSGLLRGLAARDEQHYLGVSHEPTVRHGESAP